ncbi:Uncharacterised protein [Legionella steigerwaltii]|uniref:Uncharacterized protein n=1 Tax=Legionella steigerwaltii TaxID=460 RepID=A0A378LBF2_9GAMM|nr:hypothetical protein Lstg_3322 [Legionella steigerwaltii]STY24054.1 Uncharacterised protein [Legionella steigerwaltii]
MGHAEFLFAKFGIMVPVCLINRYPRLLYAQDTILENSPDINLDDTTVVNFYIISIVAWVQ